jgi:SAM-dependent methyltransferase
MSSLTKTLSRLLSAGHVSGTITESAPEVSVDLGLYDAVLTGWYQNDTNEVFRGVPIGPGDVVVDVGCGGGGSSLFCARRGAYVAAIDHDRQVAATVRSKLAEVAPYSHAALAADAHQLPFADGVATRVICTEVLEHADDPNRILKELFRIGRSGAQYVLSVPSSTLENLQKQIAPAVYFQKPNHVRIFTEQQFASLIAGTGLIIDEQVQYGFYQSIWLALFWACEVDLTRPDHPALHHWTAAWRAILGTRSGPELKKQLDAFLPRTQLIVARKP